MKKKVVFYLVFSLCLLIGFYVLVFYNNKDIQQKNYIVISKVKKFAFKDQFGETITQDFIANKVVVVEFFFSTCDGICPKMNNSLKKIYDEFGRHPNFLILSHTVDPQKDSVTRLFEYAKQFDINNKQWLFLTGDKQLLYKQARQSYSLDDPNNNVGDINDQFLHTQFFALVNTKGEVIGIYDSLLPQEITTLKNQIKQLLDKI